MVAEILVPADTNDKRGGIYNSCQSNSFVSTFYPPNTPVGDAVQSGLCGSTLTTPCVNGTAGVALASGGMNMSSRSLHTGGSHGVMGDGPVRFFSNNMNQATFQAIGTRSGNEVIGDF